MSNVAPNPSFGDGTITPYAVSGGTSAVITNDPPPVGTNFARLTSDATVNLNLFSNIGTEFVASPGQVWSVGAYVRRNAGTVRNLRLDLIFLDSGGVAVSSNLGTSVAPGTTWEQRKTENYTAPANTAYIRIRMVGLSHTSGDAYDITGIQIEQGATLPAYNEGGLGVPQNLTATPVSSSQIDLSWDAVSGVSGYDIERDSTVIVFDHATNSYSDTGLTASTQYTYRVRSVE